jgi:glycosyltransferase involved in cell wall biosynthesis
MRILHIITKSNWGGAQRHVFDIATAMKAKGHDVWVVLGGEGLLKVKLENAGIYTFSITTLGRDMAFKKDFHSFRTIWSVIKDKRPDIIHLHSPKASGLGSLAGRLLRVKKIITTVHGWSFNESRPVIERALIIFASWITMILSHTTILLSNREYTQAKYFPGIKNKITMIPLGLKAPTFMSVNGAKQTISKNIGMNLVDFNKKIIIGTIAELHKNKGLTYLINAMSLVSERHENAICVIIGDGEEKTALHMLIKEKKLEQNVHLLGFMDNASDYLKSFNIFVLPSIKEGLPYSILEAGCASLPVVATTAGGISEIVEDMKSGILIQPKNSNELAHALSFMIEHPEERRGYGTVLKERVATKFSVEKMLWMIEGLYEQGRQNKVN